MRTRTTTFVYERLGSQCRRDRRFCVTVRERDDQTGRDVSRTYSFETRPEAQEFYETNQGE